MRIWLAGTDSKQMDSRLAMPRDSHYTISFLMEIAIH